MGWGSWPGGRGGVDQGPRFQERVGGGSKFRNVCRVFVVLCGEELAWWTGG